jgi:hypothetical protein
MSLNNDRSSCIYTESSMKEKITLVISKEVQNQINLLHNQIGKDEWSGILLYKVIEGNISEPGTLKLQADYIYPMDIGSSTYTEFDYDEHYIKMHETLPIIQDGKRVYKIGTIHTHHGMSTFFSGTDTGELHTNAPKHNFYLSLIVNFEMKPIAKVAVFSEEGEAIYKFKGHALNETYEVKSPIKGVLLTYGCQIEFDSLEWFDERLEELKAKKRAKPPVTTYYPNTYPVIGHQRKLDDDYYDSYLNLPSNRSKKGSKKKQEAPIDAYDEIFQPMSVLCACITGNQKEYSDIYNVLKRVTTDYESINSEKRTGYLFNFQERVSNNFKIMCSVHKGRNIGKYELDELAEKTLKVFNTYKFESRYEPIVNSVKLSLEKFIIDYVTD